jgi:hypothetical protein
MPNPILDHDDLSRIADQLTALLEMISCNPKGLDLLHESSKEALLGLANDLAYQVQAALSEGTYLRTGSTEDSSGGAHE